MRLRTPLHRPPGRLRDGALVLLCLLAPVPAQAAKGVKVEVAVEGLPAEMKRNVLGSMMLAAAAKEGRLTEGEARRLADRARGEIEQALQPFGYYHPTIRDELVTRGSPWKARFFVEPGSPVVLSGVVVEVTGPGAQQARFRNLVRDFPLKPGDRLEHAPYEALKSGLDRAASQDGYLEARFASRRIAVDPAADTARIELRFETGERHFFGPVRFQQDVLDAGFINSFVPFEVGEPYNVDSLIAMQRALGACAYFSRVEVEPRRDEAKDLTVPIDVRLEPAKRLRWTLGGGYGTDTGLEGTATLELRRLNKKGHRATLDVLASELRRTVSAQYQQPRAFGRKQLVTESVALIDEETDAQRNRGGKFGVSLARSRGEWQETFGLFLERQNFTVGNDAGTPNLLVPEASWLRVKADDRIRTRAGRRLSLVLRAASDQVLSDATFAQAGIESKLIAGAGPRGRVIARADAGATWTDDFHELPPGARYFAGGVQSVRAYGYQELGPHDASGEPVGGERLLFGSLEYDHRLFGDWGAAAFYDVGNALERFGDPLASGVGAGIRWISPVGMVRLDFAWPIQDASSDMKVQFSFGPDL